MVFFMLNVFKICLMRMDYNEPHKGNDQCDYEFALAPSFFSRLKDDTSSVNVDVDIEDEIA